MKKLVFILLLFVFIEGYSQDLSVSFIAQTHLSTLGQQQDIGAGNNGAITLTAGSNQVSLLVLNNQVIASSGELFENNTYSLIYNKLFRNNYGFFNYFGFGVNFNNQVVTINGSIVAREYLYGPVLSYGLGAEIGPTIFQVGGVYGTDLFGKGDKRFYSTFYISAGFKLYSFKKKRSSE